MVVLKIKVNYVHKRVLTNMCIVAMYMMFMVPIVNGHVLRSTTYTGSFQKTHPV